MVKSKVVFYASILNADKTQYKGFDMARAPKQAKEKKLEDILFDCRNALRGKVEQADNRNAVMGLVFLKFAGDKFETRREQLIGQFGYRLLSL